MDNVALVVLDFDGVVLDSATVKTDVLRFLFADRPCELPEIVRYQADNAGLSRRRQLEHIYGSILREPLPAAEAARLEARYAAFVVPRVLDCPAIDGTVEFIEAVRVLNIPVSVASGTPEPELRTIVDGRGLSSLFDGVFGSPASKSHIIAGLLATFGTSSRNALFIGDSPTDLREATRAGVQFVGLVRDGSDPFPAGTRTVGRLTSIRLGGQHPSRDGARAEDARGGLSGRQRP